WQHRHRDRNGQRPALAGTSGPAGHSRRERCRALIHSSYVRRADHVHGSNAIGDVELPEPAARATGEHASDLIIRMAKENPGEITLCPVGPVTNLALAIVKAPEIAKLLRKIVIMGSTIFHPGIHGPAAPM